MAVPPFHIWVIISAKGIEADPEKIKAMIEWPIPTTVKALRGFLGLIGYYWQFVHRYGHIAAPFTALLKKDGFHWTKEATHAFQKLEAMTSTLVLALPKFDLLFEMEIDASSSCIGVVLMQAGHPIAFFL